jgi:O-antigen/teichoic acid export membrane protein
MFFLKKTNFTTGFKRILSNTGYLFGEKVFNMGLSLIVGIYVARYLGPDDYGIWQYAQSLIALFTAIAGLGTANIVIRDLVQSPEKEKAILGTTFTLMICAGVVSAIAVVAIGFWLNNEGVTRWLIVIVSVSLVLQAFQAFDYWFQSRVLSKYSVYARTGAVVVVSILKVIFILFSLSVIYFALTAIIAGLVTGFIWVYSYNKHEKKTAKWTFDAEYAKGLLKDAWPLILSGISVAIYMKIDQVMLKNMMDSNAVGNYAVAVKISELWYFIPMAIASSVFPSIIQSKKESLEKYYSRLQYLYDIMAGMALVIAIPMTFLSSYIIIFLFGAEYASGGSVLAVHIWAGLFVFLGVARSRWIINENYQWYGMVFTLAGAAANILLNMWLIPIMGIMGAAWATVISQAIAAWVLASVFTETKIAFKMSTKAILNSLLIYPVLKSLKSIMEEAAK